MNFRASGRYLAWRLSGRGTASGPSEGDPALTTGGEPHELIAAALSLALKLSKSQSPGEARIMSLLDQIEAARRTFSTTAGSYVAPEAVLSELDAALGNVRTALAAAARADASDDTARQRVEWAAARLKRAAERVRRR